MTVLLYIMISILALIISVLMFKIKVEFDFVLDGTSFEWNGTITLLGGAVKVNLKRPAPAAVKEIEKKAQAQKPEKGREFLKEILSAIKTVLKYLKNKLTVEEFDTNLKVGFSDPMYTAILYGTYWNFVGGLYYALQQNVRLKQWNFDIAPDFENAKIYIKHRSAYSLVPLQILIAAVTILIREKDVRKLVFNR